MQQKMYVRFLLKSFVDSQPPTMNQNHFKEDIIETNTNNTHQKYQRMKIKVKIKIKITISKKQLSMKTH